MQEPGERVRATIWVDCEEVADGLDLTASDAPDARYQVGHLERFELDRLEQISRDLRSVSSEKELEERFSQAGEVFGRLGEAFSQLPSHSALSIFATGKSALFPWEALSRRVVRRSLRRPPNQPDTGMARSANVQGALVLGQAVHTGAVRRQLRDLGVEKVAADTALPRDERGLAGRRDLLDLGWHHDWRFEEIRSRLCGQGIGFACAWPDGMRGADLLPPLFNVLAIGAGIPFVLGPRFQLEPERMREAHIALFRLLLGSGERLSIGDAMLELRSNWGAHEWIAICDYPDQAIACEPGRIAQPGPEPGAPLEKGHVGPAVRYLQQRLERVGLPIGPYRWDGVFGVGTERAVELLRELEGGALRPGTDWPAASDLLSELEGAHEALNPVLTGVVPRDCLPYGPSQILAPGLAGPDFGRLRDDQERKGALPSPTASLAFSRGVVRAADADNDTDFVSDQLAPVLEGEGEARWLPTWLSKRLFGGLPDTLQQFSDGLGLIADQQRFQASVEPNVELVEPTAPQVLSRAALELAQSFGTRGAGRATGDEDAPGSVEEHRSSDAEAAQTAEPIAQGPIADRSFEMPRRQEAHAVPDDPRSDKTPWAGGGPVRKTGVVEQSGPVLVDSFAGQGSKSPKRVEARKSEAQGSPSSDLSLVQLTLEIGDERVRLYRGWADASPVLDRPFESPRDWGAADYRAVGAAQALSLRDLKKCLTSSETWTRADVEAFGDRLAAMLFTDGAGAIPDAVSEAFAQGDTASRRLVLVLTGSALSVPWEYLRIGERFMVERRTSIVRQVDVDQDAKPRPLDMADDPPVIALLVANPRGHAYFEFDSSKHKEQIEAGLEGTGIRVSPYNRCTRLALEKALRDAGLGGVHYLGHGTIRRKTDPVLLLLQSDKEETTEDLKAADFATLLNDAKGSIRFVFLGACHSGAVPAHELNAGLAPLVVRRTGIPVVAMQQAVPQDYSTGFAEHFYRALARNGYDLERAVYEARKFELHDHVSLGIPVLYADVRNEPVVPKLSEPLSRDQLRFNPGRLEVETINVKAEWADLIERERLTDEVAARIHESIDQLLERRAADDESDDVVIPAPPEDDVDLKPAVSRLLEEGPLTSAQVEPLVENLPRRRLLSGLGSLREPREALDIDESDDVDFNFDADGFERLQAGDGPLAEITNRYSFPPDLVPRLVAELSAGRHVILVGPSGTGKTTIAREIIAAVGHRVFEATASADWTSFETVGGFWPRPRSEGDGLEFAFKPGAVLEAVLGNWLEETSNGETVWKRRRERTWLLLDELNRADMDRALGGLFTALESRQLRVPTGEACSAVIRIPRDFRIVATLNGVDRHYLFRLSDALKRRFAFVHVPVTADLGDEWRLIARFAGPDADDSAERGLVDDVRRFIYLARAFHPVGTAQLIGCLKFLCASRPAGELLQPGQRLHQALTGSVLTGLEECPQRLLRVLETWATTDDPEALRAKVSETETELSNPNGLELWLATLGSELGPVDGFEATDAIATLVARTVRRQGKPYTELARHLGAMADDAAVT